MKDRGHASERRETQRVLDASEHGIRSVRIRPGHAAAVIDVSATGALIETNHRLLPGTVVELTVETNQHRARIRGRVVRCAVVQVRAATVFYRGGIAFDSHLPWFVREEGYPIPAGEQSDGPFGRAPVTRTPV